MILNSHEVVYQKISEVTSLKFKSQIKDSGIVFEQIFEMKDLVTNSIGYLLLTDKSSITFKDRKDFIQRFIIYIEESIKQLNDDYELISEMRNQAIVDKNFIYLENERIGFCTDKQLKLLNKMKEFQNRNNVEM